MRPIEDHLEENLPGKLNFTRVSRRICTLAKGSRGSDAGRGILEARMIESIEELGAKFESTQLSQGKALEQA